MNDALMANWNARIGKGDLVYHLGDFAWGDWGPVLERLNGDIILIRGGHDKKSDKKFAGHDFAPWSWEEIKTYMADRPHNENFLGSKISG